MGREITYTKIHHAQPGDLIISGLGAVYKAICVLPAGMDNLLISSEFLILRPRPEAKVDPMYLWSVLRSAAVVAEWLSSATGLARHRLDWDVLKLQRIPLIDPSKQCAIGDLYRKAMEQETVAASLREKALKELANLDLESDAALDRLTRAKPPN